MTKYIYIYIAEIAHAWLKVLCFVQWKLWPSHISLLRKIFSAAVLNFRMENLKSFCPIFGGSIFNTGHMRGLVKMRAGEEFTKSSICTCDFRSHPVSYQTRIAIIYIRVGLLTLYLSAPERCFFNCWFADLFLNWDFSRIFSRYH